MTRYNRNKLIVIANLHAHTTVYVYITFRIAKRSHVMIYVKTTPDAVTFLPTFRQSSRARDVKSIFTSDIDRPFYLVTFKPLRIVSIYIAGLTALLRVFS